MPSPSRFRYRGVFVTGTDTGVGKTIVTAALAAALRLRGIDAGVMKPAQTGSTHSSPRVAVGDAAYLVAVSATDDPLALVCPSEFREPLAPAVAARLEGVPVPLDGIRGAFRELCKRHEIVIVEGAGGIAVPLADGYLMSDLARDLDLPVLVVARPSLGTINHTVLTVRFAQAVGLDVLGVVINNWPAEPGLAESTSPAEIERYACVPVLGYVAHDPAVDTDTLSIGATVGAMSANPLVDRVLLALSAPG